MVVPRQPIIAHQLRNRRHLLAILADIVDGCRKLKNERRTKDIEEQEAAEKEKEESIKAFFESAGKTRATKATSAVEKVPCKRKFRSFKRGLRNTNGEKNSSAVELVT